MAAPRKVLAAGAVVWRSGPEGIEILVIHRPAHDDWTLPKGKRDPGERLPATAVREVLEETSVPIRLGMPVDEIEYMVSRPDPQRKRVSYWVGRPIGSGDVAHDADSEVDDVRWVGVCAAPGLLTYERDRELVAKLERLRERSWHKTRPLVVLRHAHASARARWKDEDRLRPLSDQGMREAHQLVPLLAAFGVSRIVSSDSTRCVSSVEPYADHLAAKVDLEPALSEEHADPRTVQRCVRSLASDKQASVICTHRPVLPMVLSALGVSPRSLEPGQLLVAHRRHGRVVGVETHLP